MTETQYKETQYKKIPGFPGYRASACGIVLGRRGRPLSTPVNGRGYRQVKLYDARGKAHTLTVARAVALAWVAGHTKGAEAHHIDGDKTHDHARNLEWISRKGHKCEHGAMHPDDVRLAVRLCRAGHKQYEVADMIGVSRQTISALMSGRYHRDVTGLRPRGFETIPW